MKVPCQRLARSADRTLLVIASSAHLQVADLKTGQILSSKSAAPTPDPTGSHFGLIRLLVVHQLTTASDGSSRTVLVSTGEDKMLKTWELPALKLLQSRELAKRATALSVSPNGKNIVIGDKSGDVYNLPFDAPDNLVFASDPDQELKGDSKQSLSSQQVDPSSKAVVLAPIAGHVSILTSLAFIPSRPHPFLVTADRDEHIRISRYPQAWSIETYLLGHERFVGSVIWVPGNDKNEGVVVSGGGEDEIYAWNPTQARCTQKVSVKGLSSGIRVQPEKEAWFMKTRKNQKRKKNKVDDADTPMKDGDAQADDKSLEISNEAGVTTIETATGRKVALPEICINKMICTTCVNAEDERYIVISSAGSSVLAVLPVTSVLSAPDKVEDFARYYDFNVPVLDFIDISNHELLVSLDTSQDSSSEPRPALRGLIIDKDQIFESQSIFPGLEDLNTNCSIEESSTNPMPSKSALYPELLLFHKGHLDDHRLVEEGGEIQPPLAKKKKKQQQVNSNEKNQRNGKKKDGRLLSNQRVEQLLQTKS